MENNENNGKYDDYPFPAGRMSWNGFVLVLIETIIDDIFSPQTRYFNDWSRACRICIIAMGMLL